MKLSRLRTSGRRRGISTIIGAAIIAVLLFIVLLAYFSFEINQRTSLDQAANQRNQLEHAASRESIIANASIDASSNLVVNITNGPHYSSVEIVAVIVGSVNPNSVIKNFSALQIVINPGQSYLFNTSIQYTTGNPLWAKVATSLGTVALALYPYPKAPSMTGSGGVTGQVGPSGNIGDIVLNFSTFSWYRITGCTPDPNSGESGYCLQPATGSGNSGSTIYLRSTTQPLAFSVSVTDVNPQKESITLDNLTNFLQFQTSSSCGSSICSYVWFITSNVTTVNSGGQSLNHIMNTYQKITLTFGKSVTLVFATAPHNPKCTTDCYPSPSFSYVSYTPEVGIAPNLIFAHGWEGIPTTQISNYGQNLPFTSTLYITPQITLSPTSGLVGSTVAVSGSNFVPSSTVTITYDGIVVATTVSSASGTILVNFVVPQSSGVNTVTATDASGNAASATFTVPDFSLSSSLASLTEESGGPSENATITITSLYGFIGTVTLSLAVLPATGLSASLSSTSVTLGASDTSNLTVTGSVVGIYTVTITGTGTYTGSSGSVTHSIDVTVAVPTISISPASGTPATMITLSGADYLPSTAYTYCLSTSSSSIAGCVSGTTYTFISDTSGNIPSGTTLTVPSGTPTGSDYVIFYTTSIDAYASFVDQDFSISASPSTSTISANGTSTTSTITVTSLNGFTGTVTLSATVSPSSGLTASLSSTTIYGGTGTSTLTFSSIVAGTYNITITGLSNGDLHSIDVIVTVNKLVTSISTSLSSTTITAGSSVYDSAMLSGESSTARGNVQYEYFTSNTCAGSATNVGTAVSVTGGVVPNSPPQIFNIGGQYGWEAVYSGDANNAPSTSPCEPLTVMDYTLSSSPTSASFQPGSSASFTITLTSLYNFAGSVTLTASSSPGCSGCLSFTTNLLVLGSGGQNATTLQFTTSATGTYTITVTGTSGGDTHSITIMVYVQVSSSTTVMCTPPSPQAGTPITCTATVAGASPTGTITFTETGGGAGASFSPSTCTISSGSCSVSYIQSSVGTSTIIATYSGDSNNLGGSNTASVTFVQSTTITSLTCSPSSLSSGFIATCIATVSGSNPTGTVTFSQTGGSGAFSSGGQCTLDSSGSCSVTYSQSTAGSVTINATYGGDSNNLGSVSPSVSVAFNPILTMTPVQGPIGVSVTVSGIGFSPNTAIATFTFNAAAPLTQTCTTQTTTSGGALSCTFTVPNSAAGSYTVTASGADIATVSEDTASASFTITNPAILLSPNQGPGGTTVTVTGSGFSTNTQVASIALSGGATISTQTCSTKTTSSTGTFSCTFEVPSSSATGAQSVTVSGSDAGSVPADSASASFTVTTATISINPTTCVHGTGSNKCGGKTIGVSGSGYAQSATYDYCLSTSQTSVSCVSGTTGTFTSTATGSIQSGVTIPGSSSWSANTYYVLIYDPSTNAIIAATNFVVT